LDGGDKKEKGKALKWREGPEKNRKPQKKANKNQKRNKEGGFFGSGEGVSKRLSQVTKARGKGITVKEQGNK